MTATPPQIVWFKRDLRVSDHAALHAASAEGPVIALYIVEPTLWRQPDASARHLAFLRECVQSLQAQLARIGLSLCIRMGEAVDVLGQVQAQTGARALWSHEETGNAWTYGRDLAIQSWARGAGIDTHAGKLGLATDPAMGQHEQANSALHATSR